MSADPCYTHGPQELCVWKVAPGIFWLQTTDPQYTRKLDKRKDTRRMGITGVNHYRRTYEIRGSWRKVQRIVEHYIMSASGHFSCRNATASVSESAGRVKGSGALT